MDFKSAAELGITAAAGIGGHDFLANWVNGMGESYGKMLAPVLMPLFKDAHLAEMVVRLSPMIPFVAMAIRISAPKLMEMIFGEGKTRIQDLNPEERAAWLAEISERQEADVPAQARISRKDVGELHLDPGLTKTVGLQGREKRTEPGKGSAYKNTGKTVRNTPPHGHSADGHHLPN